MCEQATGVLREVQVIETEMFLDLKNICERYNLRYFIDFGSLLGAVRHKGFIPWDDDIDISMPYEDYLKFLEIAQAEFGDKYFLQTSKTDPKYHFPFAKMRKNGTKLADAAFADWDIHQGVWLDIFPIIECNDGLECKLKKVIVGLYQLLLCDDYYYYNKEYYQRKLRSAGVFVLKQLFKIPKEKRFKMAERLIKKFVFSAKDKKYKACVWNGITKLVPKDIYDDFCMVEFEGEEFSAPKKWEERLTVSYGDYMQLPPVDQRIGHSEDMIIDLNCG